MDDSIQGLKRAEIYILNADHVSSDELRSVLQSGGYDPTSFMDRPALREGIRGRKSECVCLMHLPVADVGPILGDLAKYDVPAIVISRQGDIPTAVRMIRAGAIDFISGELRADEVVVRLKLALAEIQEKTRSNTRRTGQPLAAISTLSPREAEVLNLVATGLTSKQIANVMRLSWRTVEDHRARILEKLGAKNTAELMVALMKSSR